MDWQQIFTFLTTGPSERVLGIVVAFLIVLGILGTVAVYIFDSFFGMFKKLFENIKRREKIIEVPKYTAPPQFDEFAKYVRELKTIIEEQKNSVKL